MQALQIGPLIRATSSTSAVLWMECSQPCTVTINLYRDDMPQMEAATVSISTVTVGGHYYAAPHLQGLEPGAWYSYQVSVILPGEHGLQAVESTSVQCFRTLPSQPPAGTQLPELRLIYGSCRKLDNLEQDTLEALGHWLLERKDQRDTVWPHLLLLIGDQMYGDEPPAAVLAASPHLRSGASSFEDFTRLYKHHWTSSTGVRQVLASLPIYMMFDDHEILNGWNIVPNWNRLTLQNGKEQMLIDGLVAYWVYQGWGNILPEEHPDHPLLQIMQTAERSGEDALTALQAIVKQAVYGKIELPWHYTIPTTPPIFMTNTRADRSSIFPESAKNTDDDMYAPGRIMSKQQMEDLYRWHEVCRSSDTGVALLVSSAPVLLPPLIGLAEYLMGRRFWHTTPLHRVSRWLAQVQLRFIERLSFDHWPAYAATWQELLQLATTQQKGDIVVLSGDVHFSYAARARKRSAPAGAPSLYQLVSTPIQNTLSVRDRKIVALQAWITKLTYSGLHTNVLPLQMAGKLIDHKRHHIFQNTLAAVTLTFSPTKQGEYKLYQEYLSAFEQQLHPVAHITISSPEHENED